MVLTREARHDVEPGRVEAPRASPAAATATLASLTDAVRRRDAGTLRDLAAPGDAGSRDLLAAVVANARALDLRGVEFRFVEQVGTVRPDGTWSAATEVSWRVGLGGVDRGSSRAEVVVDLAPDGDRVAVAGFAAGEGAARTRLPLWLRGRLSIARRGDVVVTSEGTPSEARATLGIARRGVAVVRRVLPQWSGRAVVEVPGSAEALDEALGVEPGTYAGIAAVTATAGSTTEPGAPVHVFVNPEVTDGLRRAGVQVVLSHELAHVATDAPRTPMEPWLLEGFADYVALRGTTLPDRTTLGRAIASVRRDGLPEALPSGVDLDTAADDLQARYEQAWLACRIVAERLGEQGLLDVYDEAASGRSVGGALRRRGLSLQQLTDVWRTRLGDLAG